MIEILKEEAKDMETIICNDGTLCYKDSDTSCYYGVQIPIHEKRLIICPQCEHKIDV